LAQANITFLSSPDISKIPSDGFNLTVHFAALLPRRAIHLNSDQDAELQLLKIRKTTETNLKCWWLMYHYVFGFYDYTL
jgi:hypothetical protein